MKLVDRLLRMLEVGREALAEELGVQQVAQHYGQRKSLAAVLYDRAEYQRNGAKNKGVN